jgi:DNA-binding transcriptional LysR family regulator
MSLANNPPCPPNRLRQLRAFCQAARTGNMSKAADALGLSQPSISQLIRSLESDLGLALFERRGPRIQLTEPGRCFFELATPLMESVDNLPAVFRERMGQVNEGPLDIAAGESTILYLLLDLVKSFSESHPQIDLHLHNVTGRDGLEMLRRGEVDFAVGSMIEVPRDILYVPIFSYDPVLITPLDHRLAGRDSVTLEEVSRCGLILPPRHLSTWRIVDLVFRQQGLDYQVILEAGGWEIIKRAVEKGLGVSIVTSICLTGGERLARIPLDRYFPRRSYGLVLRGNKSVSPQAQRFLELMEPDYAARIEQARQVARGARPKTSADRAGDTGLLGHDESLA